MARPARSSRSGSPRPSPDGSATRVLVASDWAPIRAFGPIVRTLPEAVYGELLPLLRDADLRIVNCECALTLSEQSVWKSGAVFRGEPDHVRALEAVPFEVACLGNNHVLDYGVPGLRDTLKVLRRRGIETVGAGLTDHEAHAPLTCVSRGARIHIVNFCEGEDLTASQGGPGVFGWDIDRVIALVRQCKATGGVVLAIGHCGLEYVPYPPPYVVAAFRAIADAGADCVIGHHPHVPQGIEWRGGRPILYSLGNFAFYQHTDLHYRKTGFFVTLRCARDRVTGLDVHPYRITDAGLRLLNSRERAAFDRAMNRLSRPFGSAAGPRRAWDAYLAYYGMPGFTSEVTAILDRMKTEPQKAAAMFRNRLTTLQHAELWRDCLTAIMAGETGAFPSEAYRTVEEYFTRKLDRPATS
jgi:poly-gamma-glutamate capsule biosynthesis protein CapA/YwtB (metallophosphatase superfamily)